jgi:hypothetical protein
MVRLVSHILKNKKGERQIYAAPQVVSYYRQNLPLLSRLTFDGFISAYNGKSFMAASYPSE